MPHRVAYGLTRLYHAGSVFVTVDEKMQPIEISAAWKNEWAITGIATDEPRDQDNGRGRLGVPRQHL